MAEIHLYHSGHNVLDHNIEEEVYLEQSFNRERAATVPLPKKQVRIFKIVVIADFFTSLCPGRNAVGS